jgi:hypothetical protein
MEPIEPIRIRNIEDSPEAKRYINERFLADLNDIDAKLLRLLIEQGVASSELQDAWQARAMLSEEFVDSIEFDPEDPLRRTKVQFDVMVDKAVLFEKAGNHVRYLEELDAAEVFALNSNIEGMAESLGKELDEEIQKLGNSSEELILKLRGTVDFMNRDYLRDLLAEGLDYEDLLGNIYAMIIEEGSDPDVVFKEIGLTD